MMTTRSNCSRLQSRNAEANSPRGEFILWAALSLLLVAPVKAAEPASLSAAQRHQALVAQSMENDAQVLEAVAEHFLALASLQRLDLDNLRTPNPESVRAPELEKIKSARNHFGSAKQHLAAAFGGSDELAAKITPQQAEPMRK